MVRSTIVDTAELIQQAEGRLTELIDEQDALRHRLQAVQMEMAEIANRVLGLRDLLGQFAPTSESDAANSESTSEESWADLRLTDAVLRALEEAGTPVGPTELQSILQRHDRPRAEENSVSPTLDYLRRKGAVIRVRHGGWAIAPKGAAIMEQVAFDTHARLRGGILPGPGAEGA